MFGIAAAISWGVGDFAGGVASRRLPIASALIGSQGFGLAAALAIFALTGEPAPPVAALALAALAGLSGLGGLGSFYRAMRDRPMGIAAPAVAVIAAAVPALVGLVRGDPLGPLQLVGIVLALVAVAIASVPTSLPGSERVTVGRRDIAARARRRRSVAQLPHAAPVALAGLGFAGFYLLMDEAARAGAATWWPLLVARSASLAGVLLVAIAWRSAIRVHRPDVPLLALAGLGDLGGNAFFVLANAQGPLSIAAVLSSLYPVTTVILAAVLLGERLTRLQLSGVVLALAGVVLISR